MCLLRHIRRDLGLENSELDKIIARALFKKRKIAKAVSKLVKYRNQLINQIYSK